MPPDGHLSGNDDDLLATVDLACNAEFALVAVGGIRRITGSAIEENAIHSSFLQLYGNSRLRSCWSMAIEQLRADMGIVIVAGKMKDQVSSAGLLEISYTLRAPSKGTPLRASSLFEMVKQG